MEPKLFVAMKAFIVHDGKVLILRETEQNVKNISTHHYGCVGGRMKPGEKFEDCLRREVREETGLKIEIGRPFFVGEWRPVVKGEPWQVVAVYFACTTDSANIQLTDEHDDYQWINPADYKSYQLYDNVIPAFETYLTLKK